jgi:hypothetical protein
LGLLDLRVHLDQYAYLYPQRVGRHSSRSREVPDFCNGMQREGKAGIRQVVGYALNWTELARKQLVRRRDHA